jgi:hypothetical protein
MSPLGPSLDEWVADYGPGPDHYIYGLYDPRTLALRYIGKSDRPKARLANQMNEHSNTHRCHWLGELRALGLTPVQIIIDATPTGSNWQSIERAYIAAARLAGEPLTNGTDGGDGVVGLNDDARARIRQTWIGRRHRPESLEKIAAASRGRKHSDEWRTMMSGRMADREFSVEHRRRIRDATQKLTDDQVREIRELLRQKVSQYVIADRYQVHQGSISNIARGITYKHVTEGNAT